MPSVGRLIVSPTEPTNTANIFDTELKDSININGIAREVLVINGFPSEPLSDESLSLFPFPSSSLIPLQGTVLLDSLLIHPSNASSSSARAQSTNSPPLYRTSKPPSIAGAMGSDAPHRMAISAPETDDLSTTRARTTLLRWLLHIETIYRTGRSSLKTIGFFSDVPCSTRWPPTRWPTTRQPSTRRLTSCTPPRSVACPPSTYQDMAVASSHPP